MTKIAIVAGTTRPGRKSGAVARWVLERAQQRSGATYELLDIDEQGLPMLDEAIPPSAGRYEHDHTKRWAETVAGYDGFIFVTGEYNHGIPAALKNAIDYVYAEWNNKAAGFVSYGSAGGVRAVEHLRGVMAEVQIADVRQQVVLSLFTDFESFTTFTPADAHLGNLDTLFDQVESWSAAMATLRAAA